MKKLITITMNNNTSITHLLIFIFSFTLLILSFSIFAESRKAELRVGETLHYDITFGPFLKGKTVIRFYGKTIYDSTELFYMTYDTKFFASIFKSHIDIYATEDFFPVRIETEIKRIGKLSKGLELFYRNKNMAIFSQIIEGKEEVDTILREHPIQDITTLPFYLMGINFDPGDTLQVSLPQGELKLARAKIEEIVIDEDFFNTYSTYLIKSEPKGFKVWLNRGKNRLPIKIHIEQSKIKMLLKKIEIDKSIKVKIKEEKSTDETPGEEIN